MMLPQAIILTLSLALSLVPGQVEAHEAGSEAQLAHGELASLFADASWLHLLKDPSLTLAQRLEFAVTDPELTDWLLRLMRTASALPAIQFAPEQAFDEIQTMNDDGPVLPELKRGFAAYQRALSLLPPDEQPDPRDVSRELATLERDDLEEVLAMLTDPEIPAIVGDELQRCAEGFVALLGAALLEKPEPELALELARAFSKRAEGTPRLVVLLTLMHDRDSLLSPSVSQYITATDQLVLAEDTRDARRHVASLRMALHGC